MTLQWHIQNHKSVSSTQDILKDIRNAVEGTVIHAEHQSAGRGRHGRVWDAADGNLYMSLLLKPACHAQQIGVLSLMVGLAVYHTAQDFLSQNSDDLMLKWPNDVLLHGRKCAGILLETELSSLGFIDALYVGVGVNIRSAPLDTASALNIYSDADVDPASFRDALLEHVQTLYAQWQDGKAADISSMWQLAAHKVGCDMSVKVGDDIIRGQYNGVDEYGSLTLSLGENKFTTLTAGEIFLSAEDTQHATGN